MKNAELERWLASIGKSTFVKYYDQFRNLRVSDQEMVDRLPQEYTLKSRRTRVSNARRIFRERLEIEALNVIVGSARVDEETGREALKLLNHRSRQ